MKVISSEPNATARVYIISGAIWAIVGALAGLTAALELIAPDLIGQFPWLSFGRLRPVHVNIVAFGFVYTMLLGCAAHIVPRLCRVEKLWSEKLGSATALLWNVVFIAAMFTLMMGHTQARELAELIWPIDVLVAVSVVLFMVNVYMTVLNRKERLLYVSLWYICGGLIWTAGVYVIGNVMWKPDTGALQGLVDSVWLWFYGHNVVGLILTPMAVAMAYYVLPRAAKAPVWGHNLSLVGFWVLLVVYTHVGTHHIIQAPVPRWLKVISIVDSIFLLVPVMTVLLNLWMPLKGRWGNLHSDPGAKFVFAGTIWYFLTCIQGPLQSLPSVQRLTHFTHWVVAHAHMAILGFAGFIAIGTVYTILPRVAKRPLFSRRIADLQYWIMLISLTIMFLVLTVAGLVQGNQWLNGEAFYNVVSQLNLYMILRAVSGVGILTGLILMAVNVIMTFIGPVRLEEDEQAALPATEGKEVAE